MVIRFFLTMGFYVVLARFMYTEAVTYVPESQAYLDSAIEFLTIPPSAEWDKERISNVVDQIPSLISEAQALEAF